MTEKSGYTAIPLEEPQVPSERDLPPYSEKPHYTPAFNTHECCYQHHQQRRKAWRKALIAVLILFLGGRFLFAGLSYFMMNNNFDDQYILIQFPGLGPHHEPEIGSPEVPYNAPPVPSPPESPVCEPTIKWNGPSELLLDPRDVTGLVFSVKGISVHGSVIIRQDTHSKDQAFINITNIIKLSEDSLQKEVDIKIDIIDDDYTIVVEAPSFDGPRPTQKCVKVDTIITIPNNTHFFRSLLVDVPNSWILAENLGGIDFAYVNFKTKNGHIRAKDISASITEITTVNGHIQGGYVVSESLDVRTVNGAIEINALVNPWADNVSVTAKSINGHLDISVNELKEKQILNLKAGSVNGGVVATVPDTYHGDFSVSTLIGYSYIEGQDITYIKKTRNVKVGYKNKKDDDDDDDDLYKKKMRKMHKRTMKKTKKCRHGHKGRKGHGDDEKSSQINIEAVTGAVELYFLES
ncbi:unnamed protein product [Rhizophagus irregularis]|nr:unnamed protein product [Rhizophagus irregularis]